MYDYDRAESHIRRIKVLLKLGRYEEALREYDQLIEIEPGNHDYYFKKTAILIKISRFKEALDEINRAVKVKPDSSLYHFCKAYILEKIDEPIHSIHEIDLASRLTSRQQDDGESSTGHSGGRDEQKLPETIMQSVMDAVDDDGDQDGMDFGSGEREVFFDDDMSGTYGLDKVNKMKDLWKFHESLVSIDGIVSGNAPIDEQNSGKSFSARVRRFDALITGIINGTELYRNPSYSEFASDMYLKIPEDMDRNLIKMNKVLRKSPNNADYHYGKGLMLFSKGRLRPAIESIDAAVRLNPSKASFNYGKVVIQEKMKNISDALEEISMAVESSYNNPFLHYLKSILLYMDDSVSIAKNEIEIAISMNPSNILYHYMRKIILKSLSFEGVKEPEY